MKFSPHSRHRTKAFTLYVAVSFLPHTFQGLWKELKIPIRFRFRFSPLVNALPTELSNAIEAQLTDQVNFFCWSCEFRDDLPR